MKIDEIINDNDKIFYEKEGIGDKDYNLKMFKKAKHHFEIAFKVAKNKILKEGKILVEMGAGSCAMSIQMSKILNIRRVICTDISLNRLRRSHKEAMNYFNYFPEEIELIELDMNEKFDLPSNFADIILFYASLHHARNIWNCLSESYRILKPGGQLIALREGICPILLSNRALYRLMRTEEVQMGVSENIYTLPQYLYYLRVNGFQAEALPVIYNEGVKDFIKKTLWFLNGIVYGGSYVLIGRK